MASESAQKSTIPQVQITIYYHFLSIFRPPPPPNRKKTLETGNVEGPQEPPIRPALGIKRRLSSSDEDDLQYLDDIELENDKK